MELEKKDPAANEGRVAEPAEQLRSPGPVETLDEAVDARGSKKETSAGNPGRMVMAGAITAALLAIIAVVVAGVFQVTSRWLIVCPGDLPVNDPAPALWKQITSAEAVPASLGVPQALLIHARFKGEVAPVASGKERAN